MFFWLGGIGSVIAFVSGMKARKLIAESEGELTGNTRVWICILGGPAGTLVWLPIRGIALVNQFGGTFVGGFAACRPDLYAAGRSPGGKIVSPEPPGVDHTLFHPPYGPPRNPFNGCANLTQHQLAPETHME